MKAAFPHRRPDRHSQAFYASRFPRFETSPFSNFGEVSNTVVSNGKRPNPQFPTNGTNLAIYKSLLGVPANLPRNSGRGGPRNRADRESHALTPAHIANLIAATAHAKAIGLPFTRMITIHWGAAGVALAEIVKATGRFIDLMNKALARHKSATAWLWVLENGPRKGAHCHMLAHIPARLVSLMTASHKRWLRKITGQPYVKDVIRSNPIGGRLGLEIGNPELHASNLERAFYYLLKGANSEAASQIELARLEAGGRIIGRRCSTSQNIAQKARQAGHSGLAHREVLPCAS